VLGKPGYQTPSAARTSLFEILEFQQFRPVVFPGGKPSPGPWLLVTRLAGLSFSTLFLSGEVKNSPRSGLIFRWPSTGLELPDGEPAALLESSIARFFFAALSPSSRAVIILLAT